MPTPGTLNFPTALDTAISLFEVADQSATTLSAGIGASDTTLSVVSTTSFPSTGSLVLDSEVVYYTGKTSTTFTGCLRAQSGTSAASHSLGAAIEGQIIAVHHSILSSAIVATQTKLGFGTSVPTTIGDILTVTAAGQSTWQTPTPLAWGSITGTLANQTDLTTALATKLVAASNLSDLGSASTARTNLGLGTLATQSGTFSGTHSGTSSGTNTGDQDLSGYVPTTRTVNGHALSSDVTVSKSDVGLGSVENTALSTWVGSSNLTTLGTIGTGIWQGTAIADGFIASASIWNAKQAALGYPPLNPANNLSDVASVGTSRTNLGATTVGANLFTATNPSAISFPKIAADNTVSFRTPAQVLSDIGAQASLGFTPENSANKDAVSGYAGLTSGSLLKTAEFPAFTGDVTTTSGGVATVLATVNSNVGTFGSATQVAQLTANGKGLITGVSNVTITPAFSSLTGSITIGQISDALITNAKLANSAVANLSGTNTGDQTLNSLLPSQTGNSGKFLTTDGSNSSWGTPAGGANTALSNLASVSINTSLLAQTGVDLGAVATPFRDLYLFGSGTFGTTSLKLTGTPTGNRTWTFPDVSGTVARTDAAQTFTGVQTLTSPNLLTSLTLNTTTILTFPAAATFQHGAADVDTAPVAQTLCVQNALAGGTSDVAGANFTISGSQGKGSGVGGSILFKLANKAGTGTTQNALGTILTLAPPNTGTTALVDGLTITGGITGNPGTVTLAATGSDTNIGLTISGKGNGLITLSSHIASDVRMDHNTLGTNTILISGSGNYISIFGESTTAPSIRFTKTANADNGQDAILWRHAAGQLSIGSTTTEGQWGSLFLGTRDAGTTTVTNGLTIGHQSTGTPDVGLGSAILFNINSSTTADQNAAQIVALWTTATHASRTADLVFYTVNNAGALTEAVRFKGNLSAVHAADISTADPTSGAGPLWKLGAKKTGTNVLDTTNYLEVSVAGVTYKLALIT